MSFLSLNQQCQSTERNSQHWPQWLLALSFLDRPNDSHGKQHHAPHHAPFCHLSIVYLTSKHHSSVRHNISYTAALTKIVGRTQSPDLDWILILWPTLQHTCSALQSIVNTSENTQLVKCTEHATDTSLLDAHCNAVQWCRRETVMIWTEMWSLKQSQVNSKWDESWCLTLTSWRALEPALHRVAQNKPDYSSFQPSLRKFA